MPFQDSSTTKIETYTNTSSLTLECLSAGDEQIIIQRENEILNSTDRSAVLTITFNPMLCENSGTYVCLKTNKRQQVEKEVFNVGVSRCQPRACGYDSLTNTLDMSPGETSTLTLCVLVPNPNVTIPLAVSYLDQWLTNQQCVSGKCFHWFPVRKSLFKYNINLTLSNISKEDYGNFTIRVGTDNYTEYFTEFTVIVNQKIPVRVQDTRADEVEFICFRDLSYYKSRKKRLKNENVIDLYAVLNTLQSLEKAYIRDTVLAKECTATCSKLLVQYKAAFKQVHSDFSTIEEFMKKYRLDCPAALERIKEDRPITIKDDKGNTSKCIADQWHIVTLFITVMDKLRLDIKAMDAIHPDLRELVETMTRLSLLPPDFEGKQKVRKWLETLVNMQASEELDETQVRQMLFDLESAYNEFNRVLQDN
ncbi:uncharacterized protein LOC131935586 [Physella acuta]|uniref:uncharacterized protein LOC131935586 n=1 Tax=Physella acuta TaxID=109671 RepID=UPI0027DE3B3C|nr:uncharacterized protein LOC131935586 [Physella acuta]